MCGVNIKEKHFQISQFIAKKKKKIRMNKWFFFKTAKKPHET